MKYCKKCLQPDTRPSIKFTNEGICYACAYQEQINSAIDWEERKKQLTAIVSLAKQQAKDRGTYDCIIGVSGGKDSTFQALYAREELGLNCLLVNLAPDKISKWGAHNIENLIQQGFDTMIFRPNPKLWKKIIKYSLYEYGNPVKPTEYPLWAVSYITALNYRVPLIIQGENPSLTLGVNLEELGTGDDALDANMMDTMAGGKASDWAVDGINLNEILWYQFPDKNKIREAGIRAIWLNYYYKDWSIKHNIEFSLRHGFKGREVNDPSLTGSICPECGVDAETNAIVSQMIKYYKFGFGAITDQVCYLIRDGKMTRAEGIELIEKYDGKCGDKYLSAFCDYLEMTKEEFWQTVDKFVNKDLFYKNSQGAWEPKFKVGEDF